MPHGLDLYEPSGGWNGVQPLQLEPLQFAGRSEGCG